jgi:hypothetical protein
MIHGIPLAVMTCIGGVMKNFNLQKGLQIGLCLIAMAALVGCGTSKSSEGFGSNDNSSTVTPSGTDAMALCSQDVAGNSELKVRVMQFVDQYGQARPDYVRLQFLKIPSGWKIGNWDMNIKRWAVSPDNKSSIDETALYYQFEKKSSTSFSLIHPSDYSYQVFNYEEVEDMSEFVGVDPGAFFNRHTILVNLKGDGSSFQALRVQFSVGGAAGEVETFVDVLIPTFQADPAKYNADTRHPYTLQILHPLKDKVGQSWTQAQYYDFTRGFCF